MNGRRSAAAHVFAADVEHPVLDADDVHHLGRVLRLRDGEVVTVSDGHGRWRPFRLVDGPEHLEPIGETVREVRLQPELGVVFALTKGDRPEWVVQKLTELGIDHLWPLVTERTVVRWDASKAAKQQARLTKVVKEAAMQSRAVFLPRVHAVQDSLRDAVSALGGVGLDVALAEPGGKPLSDTVSAVIVGPEGGFTAEEVALVGSHVSLPGGILRAETAAIAAGVLLAENRRRGRGS
jgi:16S rRNA (uracil1498-N3)-methyltransferase